MCEPECGWWDGGFCIAGREHDMDASSVHGPLPPESDWPECPYADECQWQKQRDGPCAPRMQLILGKSVEGVMML